MTITFKTSSMIKCLIRAMRLYSEINMQEIPHISFSSSVKAYLYNIGMRNIVGITIEETPIGYPNNQYLFIYNDENGMPQRMPLKSIPTPELLAQVLIQANKEVEQSLKQYYLI